MAAMFDEDVTRLCGPDSRHNVDRAGYRHGTGAGSVTLGGRRVPVTRPRVRAADGSGELHLPSYDLFSSTEILSQLAMEKMRTVAEKRMRQAYHASSAIEAEGLLTALARELDRTHPGAAASLREGMAETLTILRLGVPPTLARTLHSTNPIESMIEICREHSKNVKRWRDGQMALRWCAAGMLEADHQFRRVNGHLHLPKLRSALEAHFTTNVSATSQNEGQKVA